jgi:hypothetical protein
MVMEEMTINYYFNGTCHCVHCTSIICNRYRTVTGMNTGFFFIVLPFRTTSPRRLRGLRIS